MVSKHNIIAQDICTVDNESSQYWMSPFVLKVKMKDGMEYP